jgi:hypothetical protein
MARKFINLGRFRTRDVPPRACDTAQKTEVARFQGNHYVAEREDDELVIYALHDEHGMPAQEMRATDRTAVRTLADLNRRNAEVHRSRRSA